MSRTKVFTDNPRAKIPRSTFDLSHEKLFTADMQYLYPILLKGMIPGDVFKIGQTAVVRFMPLVAPILTGVKMRTYYFFVPYRLLPQGSPQVYIWEEFITKGVSGEVDIALEKYNPSVMGPTPGDFVAEDTLWDHFGFPVGVVPPVEACPWVGPFWAYNLIWYEFFRDETLQPTISDFHLLKKRNWSKDYFTSALPFQQRGLPVALPVVGSITADSVSTSISDFAFAGGYGSFSGQALEFDTAGANPQASLGGSAQAQANADSFLTAGGSVSTDTDTDTDVTATLSTVDIADLRLAFKLQEWMEANARGGARYTEFLMQHFNQFNGDARLQRPEYIGGSSQPIIISEVLQTSSTDSEPTPQGTLAGHGIGLANTHIGSYRATEFGLVMGLCCFTAEALYQQGINREWLRESPFEFPFPIFAGLSEQEIFNEEIFVTDVADDPDGSINRDVFGFTGRFNEERFMHSYVSNKMRSTFAYWHQSRIFADLPTLDSDFIDASPRKDILAVPSEPAFVVRFGNHITRHAPIPFMPVPVKLGGV